ncbi:MAG: hypothetical protein F6K32_00945 [Desertifilum sp. SIO1I2]|nr:hypothetical protein [Desertifilum sp. SIO1I2]
MDEAGFDNREDYSYGYSRLGERCYALKSGKERERISYISALKAGYLLVTLIFKGSCNRDLFETWLFKLFAPCTRTGRHYYYY